MAVKFEAAKNRDRYFTAGKMKRCREQIEKCVARYLDQLDSADRQEPSEALTAKTTRLGEKIAKLKEEMQRREALEARVLASPDQQIDARSMATSGRGSDVVGTMFGQQSRPTIGWSARCYWRHKRYDLCDLI